MSTERHSKKAGIVALSCILICGAAHGAEQSESARQNGLPDSENPVEPQAECNSFSLIRFTPYFIYGQFVGFRIYPGADRAAFVALGLRPGDLLLQIDGERVRHDRTVFRIFAEVSCGRTVKVVIQRRRESAELELTLN